MRGRGESRPACGASSDDSVPIEHTYFVLRTSDFLFSSAARASRVRSPISAARLWINSFRGRRPFAEPTAYSQKSGKAMVESQYATTVSGSTSGFTLPELTASVGVVPDRPPHTTESVVIWMK